MSFFNSSKTPNTVSDKQMASLSRRAQKASPGMFDKKTVQQRLNSNAQQKKAGQS